MPFPLQTALQRHGCSPSGGWQRRTAHRPPRSEAQSQGLLFRPLRPCPASGSPSGRKSCRTHRWPRRSCTSTVLRTWPSLSSPPPEWSNHSCGSSRRCSLAACRSRDPVRRRSSPGCPELSSLPRRQNWPHPLPTGQRGRLPLLRHLSLPLLHCPLPPGWPFRFFPLRLLRQHPQLQTPPGRLMPPHCSVHPSRLCVSPLQPSLLRRWCFHMLHWPLRRSVWRPLRPATPRPLPAPRGLPAVAMQAPAVRGCPPSCRCSWPRCT